MSGRVLRLNLVREQAPAGFGQAGGLAIRPCFIKDMSRKPIIAANWKMNVGPAEAAAFIKEFLPLVKDVNGACDIVIVPPFVSLPAVSEGLKGNTSVGLGAQTVSEYNNGAYTGETSASMLKELSAGYVVLGHSERRQYFGETDEIINTKVKKALSEGLIPLFCIGETLEERDGGKLESVLERQVVKGMEGLSNEDASTTVIAYEPVWAIGTGRTATAEQAQEAHAFIRSVLLKTFGQEVADKVRIQYGGSVKPGNTAELMAQPDIDGALVGGASLEPVSFSQIVLASFAK